jgi:hypothetical protein
LDDLLILPSRRRRRKRRKRRGALLLARSRGLDAATASPTTRLARSATYGTT